MVTAACPCRNGSSVDPCGEKGEFHTFCHAGPISARTTDVRLGERVERGGFWFADLLSVS
jgi:diphthamide synthase (EF-2-diphthine--ammonia ligase)